MPFTDKQIAALRPKAKRYERTEPGRSGLRIRVTPRKVKTWGYLYRFGGKQNRMAFGNYPKMGVAAAHTALADAKEKLLSGSDPGAVVAEERKIERGAATVAEMVAEYVAIRGPLMRPATTTEDTRLLNREIIPHLVD